jgi:CubicO group peptidase (beta-lactamase class C family)
MRAREVSFLVAWVALASASAPATAAGPASSATAHVGLPLVPLPPQPADVPWPTETWPEGPPAVADRAALDALLAVTDGRRPGLGETRAIVIVHHGRIVAERYMSGFTRDTRLLSWSMAKSITHALLGIAVRDGKVDPDKPMGNPRWPAGDPRNAIPWRQFSNMIDGQDYHEIGVMDQSKNDAARMLYGIGRLDVAAFGASLPLTHAPGTHWNYNSAGVNLINDALGRVWAPGAAPAERRARVRDVLRGELFGPIGMTSAQPEFDAAGTFVGGSWVYATARDWARFGLLYLRDGVWNGKRILPPGWVDFARTKTPVDDCDVYGAGFWITPASGRGKPYTALTPNGPRDLFNAQGHEGQLVVIVPSKDLIVVRLGLLEDLHGWRALGDWVEHLVAQF